MTFAPPTEAVMIAARKPLLILAFVVVPAQASRVAISFDETEARNEALVHEAFEGWASGRGSVFDLLSPDTRWTVHGSDSTARIYKGIGLYAQRIAFSGPPPCKSPEAGTAPYLGRR
ncbi:hypothetical protein [Asticcacaulis tiandongensis]|uniref:hypothetical protein n=1 Tax=Asticcacaulis tiandongensis TaxID=2565365 RepID=UPI001C63CB8B|nr:hypothetical protein [Asticcacaulis tiandongensis]